MSNSSNNHFAFVTDPTARTAVYSGHSDVAPHAVRLQEKPAGNASDHTAVQATSMNIDGEDGMRKSPPGEVRKIKTPRALLPRQRAAESGNESSITPPNVSNANGAGAGATASTSSKAKITIVACQECQRKKCKCDGERPRCRACARKGVSECVYQDREGTTRMLKDKNKQLEDENEKLCNENRELRKEIERLRLLDIGKVPDVEMLDVSSEGRDRAFNTKVSMPLPSPNKVDGHVGVEFRDIHLGQRSITNSGSSSWILPAQQSFVSSTDVAGIAMKPEKLAPTKVAFREARKLSSKSVDSSTSATSSKKRPLSVDTPVRKSPALSGFRGPPPTVSANPNAILQQLVSTTTPRATNSSITQQLERNPVSPWQQQTQQQSDNISPQAFLQQIQSAEPQAVSMLQRSNGLPQDTNEPYLQQIGLFGRMHPHAQSHSQQPSVLYSPHPSFTGFTQPLVTASPIGNSRSSLTSSSTAISPRTAIMTSTNSPSLLSVASATSYPETGSDNSLQHTTTHVFPGYKPKLARSNPSPLGDLSRPSAAAVAGGVGMHHRPVQEHTLALYHASDGVLSTPGYANFTQVSDGQHKHGENVQALYGSGQNTLRSPVYPNVIASPNQFHHQTENQHQPQTQQHRQQQKQPTQQQTTNMALPHYSSLLNPNACLDMNTIGTEQYDQVMNVGFTNSNGVVVPMAMGNPVMFPYNQHGGGGGVGDAAGTGASFDGTERWGRANSFGS